MRTRVDEIRDEQAALAAELSLIQDECPHPPLVLTKEYRRGGEFDNEYWTVLKCGLCLKNWTEEGSI